MRTKSILCVLLALLTMVSGPSAAVSARAATAPLVDWQWLLDQAAAGKTTIELPNSLVRAAEDPGLRAEGQLRVQGNGYTITGAQVDGGTIIFENIRLIGLQGKADENGGDALVMRGEDTVVVLMNDAYAEGGASGAAASEDSGYGGHGVRMMDDRQDLILNGASTVMGGVGHLFGGMGVRADGCGSRILMSASASAAGSPGLAQGGSGLFAPACAKVTLGEQASASGGGSPYSGGHGIASFECENCGARSLISIGGTSMAIGGVGNEGGNGIHLVRAGRADKADLLLSDTCMIIGADGMTAGAALSALDAVIEYRGDGVQLYGGRYYETEIPAAALENCEERGDADKVLVVQGAQSDTYAAGHLSSVIHAAINRQSDQFMPEIIEDGLITRDLQTARNGFAVETGTVSQVNVSDNYLKIFMYSGTLEQRLQFQQRLMDDGEGGTRLVLIAQMSDEWPTLEATVAGLQKLLSIGISQIAYTCVAPVYHDRVLDLSALVDAIDADPQGDVDRVMCGTADDAIIFIREDKTRDYQETLMADVIRPI